jgi:hypothetical protein
MIINYQFYKVLGRYSLLNTFPLILYFILFNVNKDMRTISLIKLSDGTYVRTYQVSKEEFDLLSKDSKNYIVEWDNEIYILNNNEVIFHHLKGDFWGWFPSLTAMGKVIKDAPNRKFSNHFFEDYNPYQKYFPEKTQELIQILMNDLGLESNNIILDDNLVRKVDKAIQYQEDRQIFMITHLLHISALIGEIFLKQNVNAEWYMDRDADGETWMPVIQVNKSDGKTGTIGFVQWLYEDIMHYNGTRLDILESSYESLNDFNNFRLLTPPKR